MKFRRIYAPWILSISSGLIFGGIIQLVGRKIFPDDLFSVMSLGFVFALPAVMGAMSVYFAGEANQGSWLYRIFMPWVPTLLGMALAASVGWEGAICLVMASLVALPMSSLGGILTGLYLDGVKNRGGRRAYMFLLILIPGTSPWVESRFDLPLNLSEAQTYIDIQSSPDIIWKNISRVRKIDEPISGFFYKMGFPKPVEATLSHEGVGGVRQASFERGLVFVETITDWKRNELLSFSIKADPKKTPLTTLDEHVTVGGRYFDVLQGTYRMEPLSNGKIRLHLSSRFRVSTRFNFYSNAWAEFLMADIQNSILKVIKGRCEAPVQISKIQNTIGQSRSFISS